MEPENGPDGEPEPSAQGSGAPEPKRGWSKETRAVWDAASSLGARDLVQWLESERAAGRLQQGTRIWEELISEENLRLEGLLTPEESASTDDHLPDDDVQAPGPRHPQAVPPRRVVARADGETLMEVKGFQLPAAFVQRVNDGGITIYDPDHPNPVDAYGNRWDAELEVAPSGSNLEWLNHHVEEYFAADPHEPPPGPPEHFPGFIPYIDDFSQIVCFGQGHEGNPYCFDYRENPDQPSIIYWDDVYWRRVAPDFETLLTLFEPVAD